jgi:hypothetical protein
LTKPLLLIKLMVPTKSTCLSKLIVTRKPLVFLKHVTPRASRWGYKAAGSVLEGNIYPATFAYIGQNGCGHGRTLAATKLFPL